MINSSKRKKSAKAAAAGAILLAVMLAASACGGNGETNKELGQNNTSPSPTVDLPDNNGVIDPDVSTSEPSTEPTEPAATDGDQNNDLGAPEDAPILSGEGVFTGIADANSIEIKTADGALPIQYSEDQTELVNSIAEDANVKFKYKEKPVEGDDNLKQQWLVSIEEIK
jgi:hypothetical protein